LQGTLRTLRIPLAQERPLAATENCLIELLPRNDRRRVLGIAKHVQLTQAQVLCESGEPTRYIYFPIDSFVSLVTSLEGKPVLEVGMVGREGMLGAQVALRVLTQPLHAVVQGAGGAWRVPINAFRTELARSDALQRAINRYLYVLMGQFASSAACLRFHQITPRLARWLLLTQDRAHSASFGVTHEFLAYMLGVRRVGITTAAGTLQRKGLIEYARGNVTVRNRRGLEAATCSCYATEQRAYAALLP